MKTTCASLFGVTLSTAPGGVLPPVVVKCMQREEPMAACLAKYGPEFCGGVEERCYKQRNMPVIKQQPGILYELPQVIAVCIEAEVVIDTCVTSYGVEFCNNMKTTCASLFGVTLSRAPGGVLSPIVVKCIKRMEPMAACLAKYGPEFCGGVEERCYKQRNMPVVRQRPGTSYELPEVVSACIATEVVVDACVIKYGIEFCSNIKRTCASLFGVTLSTAANDSLPMIVVKCIEREEPMATCLAKYDPEFCNGVEERCYELQNMPFVRQTPGTLYQLPRVISECITTEVVIHSCVSEYGVEFCNNMKRTCALLFGVNLSSLSESILPMVIIKCVQKEHPMATCLAKYGDGFCREIEERCYKSQNMPLVKRRPDALYELPQSITLCIAKEVVIESCVVKHGTEFCNILKESCASLVGVTLSTTTGSTLPLIVIKCMKRENPMATCLAKYGTEFCRGIEKRCYELQNMPLVKQQTGALSLYEMPKTIAVCITAEIVINACISKYGVEFCNNMKKWCATMVDATPATEPGVILPSLVISCISTEHPRAICLAKYGADFCKKLERRCYKLYSIRFVERKLGKSYELPEVIAICITSEVAIVTCTAKYGREFCSKLESTCASVLGVSLPVTDVAVLPAAVIKCISSEHPVATCLAKYGPEFCNKLEGRCYQIRNKVMQHKPGTLYELPQAVAICITSEIVFDSCTTKYGKDFCNKMKSTCALIFGATIQNDDVYNLPTLVVKCISSEHPMATCIAKYGADFCSNLEGRCYQFQNIPYVKKQPGPLYELPQAIATCITSEIVMNTCIAKYGTKFCNKLESTCTTMLGVSPSVGSVRILPAVVISCISSEHPMATCVAKYGTDFCKDIEVRCYRSLNIPLNEKRSGSIYELPQAISSCITSEVVLHTCISRYGKSFCIQLEVTCASMLGVTVSVGDVRSLPAVLVKCISSEHPMATCVARYGVDFCIKVETQCYQVHNMRIVEHKPGTLYELPEVIASCISSENAVKTCVSKYGRYFCNKLEAACSSLLRIPLPTGSVRVFSTDVVLCIATEHPVATCVAKYGSEFCDQLKERCYDAENVFVVDQRHGILSELPESIVRCMSSEVVIHACVLRYGSEFCHKLETICASMLGVVLPSGSFRTLPPNVVKCVSSEHPMATCVAKYGTDFCNRLKGRCAATQNVVVIDYRPGALYEIPEIVTSCIATEIIINTCVSKYGSEFCTQLQGVCSSLLRTPIPTGVMQKIPDNILRCMSTENPLAMCTAKYGFEFCEGLKGRCYRSQHTPSTEQNLATIFDLSESIYTCISSGVVLHTCQSKYGADFCNNAEMLCSSMFHEPLPTGPAHNLSQVVIDCVSSEMMLQHCVSKYGRDFCNKLETACRSMLGVPISDGHNQKFLPAVARCMISENAMATCIAKYGSEFCTNLKERCSQTINLPATDIIPGTLQELPEAITTCMSSEIVLQSCIRKYGAAFCVKLKGVCCSLFGIRVPSDQKNSLPASVVSCISSENVVAICIAKYGIQFCNILEQSCSQMTKLPVTKRVAGTLPQLPEVIASCMSSEMLISSCISKYGLNFCFNLESACSSIYGVSLTGELRRVLTTEVTNCISSEMALAACVAKYGAGFCQSSKLTDSKKWKITAGHNIANIETMCYVRHGAKKCMDVIKLCKNVQSPEENPLTISESECMKTQVTMITCQSLYGIHCGALQQECAVGTGLSAPKLINGKIYQMSTSVRECITNGGVMASCILNHNVIMCNKWETQCSATFKTTLGSVVVASYYKLPLQTAICISAQDMMKRCAARIGQDACRSILTKCNGRFNTAARPSPSNMLYSLTSQNINCIVREYKKYPAVVNQ